MKVLLVAPDIAGDGGVSTAARSIAENMSDVEFHVFSRNRPESWAAEHIPMPPASAPILDTAITPGRVHGPLRRAIDRIKPDLVHVHNAFMTAPVGVPSLVTIHGTYAEDVPNLLSYPLSPWYKAFLTTLIGTHYLYERHAAGTYDHCHAVSTNTAKELMRMGVPLEKIGYVPNGVDTDHYAPAPAPESIYEKYHLPRENIVLCVGTVTPRKGDHLLVEAAARVEKATFVFAGPWPRLGHSYIDGMKKRAARAGVADRIRFLGAVPNDDLLALYNACHVYASPSITEGCSLSILEAASCGKPVISSDVGGARDVLSDDHGWYVVGQHPPAYAMKIAEALDGPAYVPALRERIVQKFSWKCVAGQMREFYLTAANLRS